MGRGMGEKARGAYILRMLVNSPPLQELVLALVSNTAPQSNSSLPVEGQKDKEPGSSSSSGPGPVIQSRNDGSKPPCVKVEGARKIWGTLRSTTTVAVANSLKALTTIAPTAFSVKRKFKTAPTNPKKAVQWWFVSRGEEHILQQLQDAWDPMHLQTAWKLEPLYEFSKGAAKSPVPTHPSPAPPAPLHDSSRDSEPLQTESLQTEPLTGPSTLSHNLPTQSQNSGSNTLEDPPLASQPPQ